MQANPRFDARVALFNGAIETPLARKHSASAREAYSRG
jgi:hypothetical protein